MSLKALLKGRLSVDEAAHSAATSALNLRPAPTERQTAAGNYKKGHIRINGLRIAIENPMGSRRRPEWPELTAHYGYIKGSEGADGDAIDVFVRNSTPDDWAGTVYVIDQDNQSGGFDEVKVMIGWDSQRDAVNAYLGNYPKGWIVGPVTAVSMEDFKSWIKSGDTDGRFSDRLAPKDKPDTEPAPAKKTIRLQSNIYMKPVPPSRY